MDVQERIARFAKMVDADPDNELGHFSLGKALAEAGQLEQAARSLERVLEINPSYSKAYQVLGEVRVKLDQQEEAIETLRTGVGVADQRGDFMPRDQMAGMLTELGETPPQFASTGAPEVVDAAGADFACSRCGRPSKRMDKTPFKGDLGAQVHNNVCQACWREWVGVGTMVINEMGLQLSNPKAQATYDEHMIDFLQLQA